MKRFKFLCLAMLTICLLSACDSSSDSDDDRAGGGSGGSGGTGGTAGSGGSGGTGGSANRSNCSDQSWIGGTTEICNGVLTYRDYVYDDHGADTSPVYNSPIGNLSPRAGDASYPADSENTADLVKLELSISGNQLVIAAELNALFTADSTLLGIAIDTDNDPTTGGGPWTPLNISSSGWEVLHVISVGDPASNRMTSSIAKPSGSTWRVQAAVAQANGTVMNVAYRGTNEEAKGLTPAGLTAGTWWEDKQAAALATGDISAFGHVVRVADLVPGKNSFDTIAPGLHQRVYTSQYTLPPGEGVSVDGVPGRHGDTGNPCEQYFNYLGKYQPYGIYIPDQSGPHGVQFVLHGCAANHASLINGPGMQARFGEDLNRILFVPLGRGPQGYYSDISERDLLDAYADLLANYPVDQDKVFSGGYSMGGYGTLRMAALYPQLFAGAVNWVGFTGDIFNTPLPGNPIPPNTAGQGSENGGVGNVIDFIGNLRHIPTANLYAGGDELVHATTGLAMGQAFANAQDVPYRWWFHPAAEHLTFALLDEWVKEAEYSAGRLRVHNPQRVTYRTDESLAYPEYAIKHDRAYWISGIQGRGPGYIDIDLTSAGCGGTQPAYSTGQDAGVGPVPLAWVSQFRNETSRTPLTAAAQISGSLGNVKELTIDVTAACLGTGLVQYDVNTDGAVTLRLGNGRSVSLLTAGNHQGSF
jgi:pimeloyl-ACP methyl ester carboxylesterase